MKKKLSDLGLFGLLGLCVLVVACLTGCSSGGGGGDRNNESSDEPPSEGGEGLPDEDPEDPDLEPPDTDPPGE